MISTSRYLHYLEQLQREFEHLYRLDPAPNVSQFLVEPEEGVREALLVYNNDPEVSTTNASSDEEPKTDTDDLYVALALDPKVLESLGDPHLAETNLEAFCLAVEGVSHFLCVIHRAREGRTVSALELELQAEVDKFVAALMLVRRCQKLAPRLLLEILYGNFSLNTNLTDDEKFRYQQAALLAQRYAQRLETLFLRKRRLLAMIYELRHFYRMSMSKKRRFIEETK